MELCGGAPYDFRDGFAHLKGGSGHTCIFCHGHFLQTAAARKRRFADFCDTVGDADALETAAAPKRRFPNFGDTVGDIDALETAAVHERKLFNISDTVGDDNICVLSPVFRQETIFYFKIR